MSGKPRRPPKRALTFEDIAKVDDSPKTEVEKAWQEGFEAGREWDRLNSRLVAYHRRQSEMFASLPLRMRRHAQAVLRGRRWRKAGLARRGLLGWRERAMRLDRDLHAKQPSLSRKARAEFIARKLSLHWRTVYAETGPK